MNSRVQKPPSSKYRRSSDFSNAEFTQKNLTLKNNNLQNNDKNKMLNQESNSLPNTTNIHKNIILEKTMSIDEILNSKSQDCTNEGNSITEIKEISPSEKNDKIEKELVDSAETYEQDDSSSFDS